MTDKNLNKFVKIGADGTKQYEKFRWYREWSKYAHTIQDPAESLAFHDAITAYGIYGTEPIQLTGDALAYFDREIRPALDRQHALMLNSLDIERYE